MTIMLRTEASAEQLAKLIEVAKIMTIPLTIAPVADDVYSTVRRFQRTIIELNQYLPDLMRLLPAVTPSPTPSAAVPVVVAQTYDGFQRPDPTPKPAPLIDLPEPTESAEPPKVQYVPEVFVPGTGPWSKQVFPGMKRSRYKALAMLAKWDVKSCKVDKHPLLHVLTPTSPGAEKIRMIINDDAKVGIWGRHLNQLIMDLTQLERIGALPVPT